MSQSIATITKLFHTKDIAAILAYSKYASPNHVLKRCHCRSLHNSISASTRWNTLKYVNNVRFYSTNPHDQKVVHVSPAVVKVFSQKLKQDKDPDRPDLNIWQRFLDAANPYMKLARTDRPIGTWLLFWPCSWSISLAAIHAGIPLEQTLYNMALFFIGSFVMRGAGCTINDMWDSDIDKQVERTKDRPLVSGALTHRQALMFLALQLSVGLAILLQLNWYSVALGASSMVLVVAYPLAKRVTNYPQIFLGATFNWGALLGYTAQVGEFEPSICLPLYAGALCWSVVYDTIYAHQDKEDDARIGMKSTALTFGEYNKPLLSAFAAGTLAGVAGAGYSAHLDAAFYAALAGVAVHVGRQIYKLQMNNPQDCAKKFKSNSLVGLMVLLGIVGGGWTQYREKLELGRNERERAMDS